MFMHVFVRLCVCLCVYVCVCVCVCVCARARVRARTFARLRRAGLAGLLAAILFLSFGAYRVLDSWGECE